MKIKPRSIEKTILKAIKTFPAVVLTGSRQSGKTTVFKKLFSNTHAFVSLEDPDIRVRAKSDPRAFLKQYPPPVVIDEIQYVPELLSYIKSKIDQNRKPGQWLITGSQNFVLMPNVTESLAGRAAVLSLLPFSLAERADSGDSAKSISEWLAKGGENKRFKDSKSNHSLEEIMLRGFYPEVASNKRVDRQLWCGSYITTYLERDVRNLSNIGDLSQFERFLIACAIRTGQILNISELARDIGISVPTAKRWLSILTTGYQIYLLYPYYKNIGKRVIKSPKIYFNDIALCSYLLGYSDSKTIMNGPGYGHLFETMIVSDFLKRYLNFGKKPSMYYFRSKDGLEVDLVLEENGKIYLFEIKSAKTITLKHASCLLKLKKQFKNEFGFGALITGTDDSFSLNENILNLSWKSLLT